MKRRIRTTLMLFLLVAAQAPADQATLESLLARHVEALGGRARLEAIETVRMRGRATTGPGREALVTREVRPPGRVRTEFEFQGVTAVYACDGERCWAVDPREGDFEPRIMPETEASIAIAQADVLGPLVDWEAKGHAVELVGAETLDGREVFKLKVTLKGGAVQTSYLDAESALLVRREATRSMGGGAVDVVTTFSDFRSVGGVVFAHSIISRAQGQPGLLEVIVEEAEFNPGLDDDRFELPGG